MEEGTRESQRPTGRQAQGAAGNAASTMPTTGVQQQQQGRRSDAGSDVLSSQQLQDTLQHLLQRQLCSDTPLLQATVECLLARLPDAEQHKWLVLQPAVFDELVDTCGDLGLGSTSSSSTAGNNGTDRLLLDELLNEAVGGQVDWLYEDGSAPERPPPQHIVFFVRTPLPREEGAAADPQQQQQQPAADAPAEPRPTAAGCSHMSLVLLHNAWALAHTAYALTAAGRKQKACAPEGGERALLLHIDPHRHRYLSDCCAGGQAQCSAEYSGMDSGLVLAPILAYLQRRVRQAAQGPTPRAGQPGILSRLSLLSGIHVACTSLAPPPLPASCVYGSCPCHAAVLVALDWMLAWPMGQAVLAMRAPAPTMTPSAVQHAPCSHTGLLYSSAWFPPTYVVLLDAQLRNVARALAAQQQQQQQQYTLRQLAGLLLHAPEDRGKPCYPGPLGHLQLCRRLAAAPAWLAHNICQHTLQGWTSTQVAVFCRHATAHCKLTGVAQQQEQSQATALQSNSQPQPQQQQQEHARQQEVQQLSEAQLGHLWGNVSNTRRAGVMYIQDEDWRNAGLCWDVVQMMPAAAASSRGGACLQQLVLEGLQDKAAASVESMAAWVQQRTAQAGAAAGASAAAAVSGPRLATAAPGATAGPGAAAAQVSGTAATRASPAALAQGATRPNAATEPVGSAAGVLQSASRQALHAAVGASAGGAVGVSDTRTSPVPAAVAKGGPVPASELEAAAAAEAAVEAVAAAGSVAAAGGSVEDGQQRKRRRKCNQQGDEAAGGHAGDAPMTLDAAGAVFGNPPGGKRARRSSNSQAVPVPAAGTTVSKLRAAAGEGGPQHPQPRRQGTVSTPGTHKKAEAAGNKAGAATGALQSPSGQAPPAVVGSAPAAAAAGGVTDMNAGPGTAAVGTRRCAAGSTLTAAAAAAAALSEVGHGEGALCKRTRHQGEPAASADDVDAALSLGVAGAVPAGPGAKRAVRCSAGQAVPATDAAVGALRSAEATAGAAAAGAGPQQQSKPLQHPLNPFRRVKKLPSPPTAVAAAPNPAAAAAAAAAAGDPQRQQQQPLQQVPNPPRRQKQLPPQGTAVAAATDPAAATTAAAAAATGGCPKEQQPLQQQHPLCRQQQGSKQGTGATMSAAAAAGTESHGKGTPPVPSSPSLDASVGSVGDNSSSQTLSHTSPAQHSPVRSQQQQQVCASGGQEVQYSVMKKAPPLQLSAGELGLQHNSHDLQQDQQQASSARDPQAARRHQLVPYARRGDAAGTAVECCQDLDAERLAGIKRQQQRPKVTLPEVGSPEVQSKRAPHDPAIPCEEAAKKRGRAGMLGGGVLNLPPRGRVDKDYLEGAKQVMLQQRMKPLKPRPSVGQRQPQQAVQQRTAGCSGVELREEKPAHMRGPAARKAALLQASEAAAAVLLAEKQAAAAERREWRKAQPDSYFEQLHRERQQLVQRLMMEMHPPQQENIAAQQQQQPAAVKDTVITKEQLSMVRRRQPPQPPGAGAAAGPSGAGPPPAPQHVPAVPAVSDPAPADVDAVDFATRAALAAIFLESAPATAALRAGAGAGAGCRAGAASGAAQQRPTDAGGTAAAGGLAQTAAAAAAAAVGPRPSSQDVQLAVQSRQDNCCDTSGTAGTSPQLSERQHAAHLPHSSEGDQVLEEQGLQGGACEEETQHAVGSWQAQHMQRQQQQRQQMEQEQQQQQQQWLQQPQELQHDLQEEQQSPEQHQQQDLQDWELHSQQHQQQLGGDLLQRQQQEQTWQQHDQHHRDEEQWQQDDQQQHCEEHWQQQDQQHQSENGGEWQQQQEQQLQDEYQWQQDDQQQQQEDQWQQGDQQQQEEEQWQQDDQQQQGEKRWLQQDQQRHCQKQWQQHEQQQQDEYQWQQEDQQQQSEERWQQQDQHQQEEQQLQQQDQQQQGEQQQPRQQHLQRLQLQQRFAEAGVHNKKGRLRSSYGQQLSTWKDSLADMSTPDLLKLLQEAGQRSTGRNPPKLNTAQLTAACEELHARRVAEVQAEALGMQQAQGGGH